MINLDAEFHFHGTTVFYFDRQFERYGRYQQDGIEYGHLVRLTLSLEYARRCAEENAERWHPKSDPLILQVPKIIIAKKAYPHPVERITCVDFLNVGEFEIND
jgi:hypothetical protein